MGIGLTLSDRFINVWDMFNALGMYHIPHDIDVCNLSSKDGVVIREFFGQPFQFIKYQATISNWKCNAFLSGMRA